MTPRTSSCPSAPAPAATRSSFSPTTYLGNYDERPPRHAKAYRNSAAEHRRLQHERLAAFREYITDVNEGRFPERSHLVEMEASFLDEVVRSLGGKAPNNRD